MPKGFRWDDANERRLLLLVAEKSSTPSNIWKEIAAVMSDDSSELTPSAVRYFRRLTIWHDIVLAEPQLIFD